MSVQLRNKQAFEEILKNYQPSTASIELLQNMPLVILIGITGAGRNTIINHLVETAKYKFIISDTTRPPKVRNGQLEQHGVNYYFRTEEEVLLDLQEGKLLEAEVIHGQQVSGISIRELQQVAAEGMIPINEVDIGGTDSIHAVKPDTQFFFIVPPSYEVWMERLLAREQMSQQELDNRIQTAVKVLERGIVHDSFTFVINDDSAESADRIDKQVTGHIDIGHHEEAKAIANKLLQDIRRYHA